MPKKVGSNIPLTGLSSVQLPSLSDVASSNWEQVMSNTAQGFAAASQGLDAQMTVATNEYNRKIKEWSAKEEQRQAQAAAGGSAVGEIGSAVKEVGKQLLAGWSLSEEIKLKAKELEYSKSKTEREEAREQARLDLSTRSQELEEKRFAWQQEETEQKELSEEEKAKNEALYEEWEGYLYEKEAEISQHIGQYGREQGVNKAYEVYNEFLNSDEYKALPAPVRFRIAKKVRSNLAQLSKESADTIYKEKEKQKDQVVQFAVSQYKLEYSSGLQRLRTAGSALTEEQATSLATELIYGSDSLVEQSDSLRSVLGDSNKALAYKIEIIKEVGSALGDYYKVTGTNASNAANFVAAAEQLRVLEALRDSGSIDESQYQAKAKEVLLGHGIETDPNNMPTTRVRVTEDKINNLEQRRRLTEATASDKNLAEVLGENTPKGRALIRRNVGVSMYNAINGSYVETRVAELEALKKNYPQLAQASRASEEIELLGSYHTDRTRLAQLNQKINSQRVEIERTGYKINRPDKAEYVLQPNTPLGTGQGVTTSPEVILIPAENRVPLATPQELEAQRAELESMMQERDVLLYKWAQYGINVANPQDRTFLNKLEQETQASQDYLDQQMVGKRDSGERITPDKLTPDRKVVVENKARNAVFGEAASSNRLTIRRDSAELKGLDAQAVLVFEQAVWSYKQSYVLNMGQNGKMPTFRETLFNLITENGKYVTYDSAGNIQSLGKGALLTNNFEALVKYGESDIDKFQSWADNKYRWYSNRFTGESRPAAQPRRDSNFSRGSGKQPQRPLPEQKQNNSPFMPLNGNLATMREVGFVPFKGGTVRATSGFNQYRKNTNSYHMGVDLVSDDPRVATVQGGEVLYAGNWGTYGNVVFVRTGDNHVEVFAHLKTMNVRKGDVIDPATQVGIMGNTGRSFGSHLHFEVWTNTNSDVQSVKKSERGYVDPLQYLREFQGVEELPRNTGTKNSETYQGYHSGVIDLGGGDVYYNGYIFNKRTGELRQATRQDMNSVRNGTPLADRRNVNQYNPVIGRSDSGGEAESYYEPPAQAKARKHFLMVRPAGYTDPKSKLPVFFLEGYENGRKVFSKPMLGGRGGLNVNRNRAGIEAFAPDGEYRVHPGGYASTNKETGGWFIPTTPTFKTGRSALGIHYDASGDGTQGCFGLINRDDELFVRKWVQSKGGTYLYVNTVPTQRLRGASPMNQVTSRPLETGKGLSIYKVDYQRNNVNDTYGYRFLEKTSVRQAYHEAANKLGVPTVWLADISYWESKHGKETENMGYIGLIQFTSDTLHDLGMRLEGKPFTRETLKQRSVEWQISTLLPEFFVMVQERAGKKIETFEDLAVAVWGGAGALRMSPQARGKLTADIGGGKKITWTDYRERLNRDVSYTTGRSYAFGTRRVSSLHQAPRDSCPVCRSMQRSGSFAAHYYYN